MGNTYQTFGKVLFKHKWSLACFTRQWTRSWSWKHSQDLLVSQSVQDAWHCLFGNQFANAEKSWHLSFRHFCLQLVSLMITASLPNCCQKSLTKIWLRHQFKAEISKDILQAYVNVMGVFCSGIFFNLAVVTHIYQLTLTYNLFSGRDWMSEEILIALKSAFDYHLWLTIVAILVFSYWSFHGMSRFY